MKTISVLFFVMMCYISKAQNDWWQYNSNISYSYGDENLCTKDINAICSEIIFSQQYNKDIKNKLDSLDYALKYNEYNMIKLYDQRKSSRNIILSGGIITMLGVSTSLTSPIIIASSILYFIGVVNYFDSEKWLYRSGFGAKLYIPNTYYNKPTFIVKHKTNLFKYDE